MVSYSKLYVNPDEIRTYLGVDEDKYSDELLVDLILEKMEYVDRVTGTTWNGRLKRVREMHDITRYRGGWLCVSSDTEVLTPNRGWVKATDIKDGDLIYGVDLRYMKMEPTRVRVVQKGIRNDKVIVLKNNNRPIEFIVSPEQNIPVMAKDGSFVIISSRMLVDNKDLYVILGGAKVSDSSEMLYEVIPGYFNKWEIRDSRGWIRHSEVNKESVTVDMKIWMKFLGLFISDGWISEYDKTVNISVHKDKVRKWFEKEVLSGFPFKMKYVDHKKIYTVKDRRLYNYLVSLGFESKSGKYGDGARKKFIPRQYLNLPRKYLEALLEGLMMGDGSWKDGTVKGVGRYGRFATVSNKLKNDFVELVVKLGYRVRIRKVYHKQGEQIGKVKLKNRSSCGYIIEFSNRKVVEKIPDTKIINGSGIEFVGIGLEKYHVFIAKRNGRVMYLANWGAGIPIHLGHSYVKKVEHLYVQWASKNEDWVQTRNEGRNFGSYWLDYQTGILYIQTWALYQGGKEIKIQYVYGREDLPIQIKELTKLLVVRDLIMNERRLFALAEGAQGVSWSDYVKYLDERIEMLEEQFRALKVGYVVSYEMGELSDDDAQVVWDEWYNNEFAW